MLSLDLGAFVDLLRNLFDPAQALWPPIAVVGIVAALVWMSVSIILAVRLERERRTVRLWTNV